MDRLDIHVKSGRERKGMIFLAYDIFLILFHRIFHRDRKIVEFGRLSILIRSGTRNIQNISFKSNVLKIVDDIKI